MSLFWTYTSAVIKKYIQICKEYLGLGGQGSYTEVSYLFDLDIETWSLQTLYLQSCAKDWARLTNGHMKKRKYWPDKNILIFQSIIIEFNRYKHCIQCDQHHNIDGIINSAYEHDRDFGCQYMVIQSSLISH